MLRMKSVFARMSKKNFMWESLIVYVGMLAENVDAGIDRDVVGKVDSAVNVEVEI